MMTTDTQIRTPFRQLMRVGAAAVLALGLAACGGSSNTKSTGNGDGTTTQQQTPYQKADAAIKAATTVDAVDAALKEAKANTAINAPDIGKLETAATNRKAELMKAANAKRQLEAVKAAAGEVDTSDLKGDKLATAEGKITALEMALENADDVSPADKATYQKKLEKAKLAVASEKLDMALGAFSGVTPTKAQLDTAMAALRELRDALKGAENLTDDEKDRYQAQADRADADNGQIKTAQGHYRDHVVKNIEDTQIAAAMRAVGMVTDTSDDSTVTDAQNAIDDAKTEIDGANISDEQRADLHRKLAEHQGALNRAKDSRMAAMKKKEADRMAAAQANARVVYAGIAPYNGSDSNNKRDKRYAQFNDQGNSSLSATPDLSIEIRDADTVRLKPDSATVEKLKGWTGSKWKLVDEGTTYEAVVYDNRYSKPGNKFNVAWTIQSDGQLNEADTRTGNDKKVNSVTTAGSHRVGAFGEVVTGIRGEHSGVPGTYSCTPAIGYACAVGLRVGNHTLGGVTDNNNILSGPTYATWRFKPDNPEQRIKRDDDVAFVTYGYWIRKGADGRWDVSAFHNNNRGENKTISSLTSDVKLQGTATYDGGAVGVYALSAEAGTFTADAELVANFTTDSVTGTIDGFMTKGFTGGDGMSRNWSVELQKLQIGSAGGFSTNASNNAHGRTRWTMDGDATPAAGKWEGAFYERGGAGQRPKAATGSFYAEHGTSGRMVGAFGVTDPNTDEPLVE